MQFDWLSVINLNLQFFKFAGLWPRDGFHLNLSLLRGILINLIFGVTFSLCQSWKLITNLTDVQVLAGTAFTVISEWGIFLKIFCLVTNIKPLQQLTGTLNDELFQLKNFKQLELIKPDLRIWQWNYNLLAGSISCAGLFFGLVAYRKKDLPFICWYPYNPNLPRVYEATYAHQLLCLSYLACLNLNLDTFIMAFCVYAGAQIDILSDNLKNLKIESFRDDLIVCMLHYEKIKNFVQSCNETFSVIILTQLISSALSLGVSMFLIAQVEPLSNDFYSFAFYTNAILFEIFSYCWFGNELQVKSSKLFLVTYKTCWIDTDKRNQQDLMFFMLRIQNTLKFSAMNLFDLSLQNFLKVLKTGYSYYALVRRIDSN